jgi:hypothetical protein
MIKSRLRRAVRGPGAYNQRVLEEEDGVFLFFSPSLTGSVRLSEHQRIISGSVAGRFMG